VLVLRCGLTGVVWYPDAGWSTSALVRCVLVLHCGLAGVVWYPDVGWSTSALVRCVLVLRCGLTGVVWYPDGGWSTSASAKPQRNTTHIEPEQYNPWNNSTNKSQAPEDGCINIWNVLSIK